MRYDINKQEDNQKMIDWAIKHGINHFESCWFYLDYQCENFLYSLLKKYNREDYYICGKLPIHNIIRQNDFKEIFKQQIERVPGNYFDTYLLQALDERAILDLKEQNIIPFFLQQKKLGTIKRFGLSIQCKPEIFEQLLKLKCWDVVQMPLNYYDWYLCRYDENYNLACQYNIPIIAQAPVKGGLLTNQNYFNNNLFLDRNRNNIESAYDFLQSLSNIELILCGNSTLSSLKNSYDALSSFQLVEDFSLYKNAINIFIKNNSINCLYCGRCNEVCEQHLPISAYIQLYNLGLKNKIYFNALDILKQAPDEPNHLCNYCEKCVEVCPLENNIPHLFYSLIFELRT